jgi:hypothetical protein
MNKKEFNWMTLDIQVSSCCDGNGDFVCYTAWETDNPDERYDGQTVREALEKLSADYQ